MSEEIEKIFSATAQSPWHFLNMSGQGCYIPAYQRPYSWDSDNVERLLEDALNGVNQLMLRPRAISFLGTIIAIHDTKYRTVKPVYRQHVPPRVMTIIDGQQRICTFVMVNIAFHDLLSRHERKFSKRKEEHLVWLVDQCRTLGALLCGTYQIDVTTGDELYRYYPRVTRAYDDAWSKRHNEAHYGSPIARLVWEYIQFSYSDRTKAFRYLPQAEDGSALDEYRPVSDIFQYIQRALQRTCRGRKDDDFPDILKVAKSESFCESVWGFPLPDYVVSYLAEQASHRDYADVCEVLRAVILAKYMNNRMAFTIVTTESEDDAFDMFEALNTTGEPLTAFETFKPRVIESEKLEKYEMSPSRRCIDEVEDYLNLFRKADARQKATSELLVPFALADRGDKLQKRLNDQRRYLRDEFDDLPGVAEKRDFVQSLAHLATFMRTAWDVDSDKAPELPPFKVADEEALVSFQALRQLKHAVTIAPLARFYDEAKRSKDDAERISRLSDLVGAIKATAAFSMLWRGAKGGTENIDARYRDVMRVGIKTKNADGDEVTIPPLCKRPKDATGVVSLANLKHSLRTILMGETATKEEWVKAAARTPIYKHSTVVARFLLLCASHDGVVDTSTPGLIRRGRPGIAPLLNLKVWTDQSYLTVEHVAPQKPADAGWKAILDEEDVDIVDRLGNLTLLPQLENAIVGNRTWEHKLLFYRMLAAETAEAQAAIITEATTKGLTLSNKASEAMAQAKHIGLCMSLGGVTGGWTAELIDQRSRRIAELAWEKLAPWLDLSA